MALQSRQINTPNVALAQDGFRALQSKQTLFSDLDLSFFKNEFLSLLSTYVIIHLFDFKTIKIDRIYLVLSIPIFNCFMKLLPKIPSFYPFHPYIILKSQKKKMQEEELTTEERIKWLRERGIQVHIPNEKPETNDSEIEEICVVKIPHDERLPFEEVLLKLRSDKAGDQCLDLLKDYFRSDNTYDDLDKELLNNINKELGDFNIKSSTINKQLQSGGTEAFTLMYPCQENHFTRFKFSIFLFLEILFYLNIL
jgi:hypothetical protein